MYHCPLTNTSSLKIAAAYCIVLLDNELCLQTGATEAGERRLPEESADHSSPKPGEHQCYWSL
jgi:hypothetical protein